MCPQQVVLAAGCEDNDLDVVFVTSMYLLGREPCPQCIGAPTERLAVQQQPLGTVVYDEGVGHGPKVTGPFDLMPGCA